MLEVKKCGKTEYGYWAIGTLKYNGLEVKSIFKVDRELLPGTTYDVENVIIYNSKNGTMSFKLEML